MMFLLFPVLKCYSIGDFEGIILVYLACIMVLSITFFVPFLMLNIYGYFKREKSRLKYLLAGVVVFIFEFIGILIFLGVLMNQLQL